MRKGGQEPPSELKWKRLVVVFMAMTREIKGEVGSLGDIRVTISGGGGKKIHPGRSEG